jgi:mRNA-degrading endonuclease RelE of RelBE toxin-antitoxin system
LKYTPKKQFVKDVQALPKKVKEEVTQLLQEIEKAEFLTDLPSVKKMTGHNEFYRIRIGNYRLGLSLSDNELFLLRILHRKDIYKKFPPQ